MDFSDSTFNSRSISPDEYPFSWSIVDESSREKYIGDDEIEELLGIDVNNSDADEDYVSRIS